MISIRITNQRDFTSKLFANDCFDSLLLDSAQFSVFSTFMIDGRRNDDFFDSDDLSAGEHYLPWSRYRSICFQIMKGTRKPLSFKLIFRLDKEQLLAFASFCGFDPAQLGINALFWNIHYQQNEILCTTGISTVSFLPDRTIQQAFDRYIQHYLKSKSIEFDIC
jgi:hypothetical protein